MLRQLEVHGKKKVGTFSDVSVFSFFGNKTITTGEGGMICFKSKKYYEHAKILRDHGMSKKILAQLCWF